MCIIRSVAASSQLKHSEAAAPDTVATTERTEPAQPAAIHTEPADILTEPADIQTAPDIVPAVTVSRNT